MHFVKGVYPCYKCVPTIGKIFTDFISYLYSATNAAISRVMADTESRDGNAVIVLCSDVADISSVAQSRAYGIKERIVNTRGF
ncbi:hypothetical protein GQ53DRAFT_741958 [Thozetella sp. PMI_491]|nr:hypothetical protein GQ53DRAFT_741958 [Thozetella sp. PMI_491]